MIFISAGHHEIAQGAKYKDVTEFILTVKWADLITNLLGESCLRVPNGVLKEKVKFINNNINAEESNIAVEIHFNSAKLWKDQNANGIVDDGEMINVGRGSETLYLAGSRTGKAAAETMQGALGLVMKPNRGAKIGWYQMNPAKGSDFFLDRVHCKSLIIEPDFIDNLEELNQNMNVACHIIASTLLEIEGGL